MKTDLFETRLISPENLFEVAAELEEALANRQVSIELTQSDGKVVDYHELQLYPVTPRPGGVQATDREDRGGMLTNSSHLSLLFKAPDKRTAFHFETADDPVLRWLSPDCLELTVKQPRGPKEVKRLLIAITD